MPLPDNREFLKKLQPYTVELFQLENQPCEIVELPAKKLLNNRRFDLAAKTLYLQHLQSGFDMNYAKHAYCRHIEAMNPNHREPGQPDKNSIDKYVTTFEELFRSFQTDGFRADKTLIPIDRDCVLLDGAHRVSCAAVLNMNIRAVRFPELDSHWSITADHLRKNLLDEESIDAMCLEFVRQHDDLYMLCLWPSASAEEEWVSKKIASAATVVNRREMMLDLNQLTHLMAQVYMTQDWIGSAENLFGGVSQKSTACFKAGQKTVFYLLECSDFDTIANLKADIRDHFQMGKHSVHITDTIEECRQIADLVFNPNSRHHLLTAFPFRFQSTVKAVYSFAKLLEKNAIDKNRVVIDSGAVLGIYGLRESSDIDFFADIPVAEQEQLICDGHGIVDSHDDFLKYHDISKAELLYHPLNYFTFMGMKFVSIPRLIKFKTNRAESKDLIDVKILQQCLSASRSSWRLVLLRYQNYWLRNKRYWERKIKDNLFVRPMKFLHLYNVFSAVRRSVSKCFHGGGEKK